MTFLEMLWHLMAFLGLFCALFVTCVICLILIHEAQGRKRDAE